MEIHATSTPPYFRTACISYCSCVWIENGSSQRPRYTISPSWNTHKLQNTSIQNIQVYSSTGTYNAEIHMSLIRLKKLIKLEKSSNGCALTEFAHKFHKRRWKF